MVVGFDVECGSHHCPLQVKLGTVPTSLFADGVRQVRARMPNGNPQDNSGICFNGGIHPDENCRSYKSAGQPTGNFNPTKGQSYSSSSDKEWGDFKGWHISYCDPPFR